MSDILTHSTILSSSWGRGTGALEPMPPAAAAAPARRAADCLLFLLLPPPPPPDLPLPAASLSHQPMATPPATLMSESSSTRARPGMVGEAAALVRGASRSGCAREADRSSADPAVSTGSARAGLCKLRWAGAQDDGLVWPATKTR